MMISIFLEAAHLSFKRVRMILFLLFNVVYTQQPCRQSNTDNDFGMEITEGEGLIQSANYPSEYPPDSRCRWLLIGNQITLSVNSFNIELGMDFCHF